MSEGEGQVNLDIGVISGLLQRNMTFNLLIFEMNAIGNQKITINTHYIDLCHCTNAAGGDYVPIKTSTRILNSSTNIRIGIPIINDLIFELTESFLVNLVFSGLSRGPIQSSAKIIILDDDGM